jgi:hypothetical protein
VEVVVGGSKSGGQQLQHCPAGNAASIRINPRPTLVREPSGIRANPDNGDVFAARMLCSVESRSGANATGRRRVS